MTTARPTFLSSHSSTSSRRAPSSFPSLPSSTRGSSSLAAASAPATGAWGSPAPPGGSPAPPAAAPPRKKGPSLSLGPAGQAEHRRDSAPIHPLKHTWEVWFSNRAGAKQQPQKDDKLLAKETESREQWETGVVRLGFFSSVESLHPFLAHLTPPSLLPSSLSSTHALFAPLSPAPPHAASHLISDLNIFRAPVAPAWEDPANAGGGRWVLRLRKGVADRVWDEVVWALVGARLERESDEGAEGGQGQQRVCRVNGVVLSVRKDEDILSVWCAPSPRAEREFVRDALRQALSPLLSPTALANLVLDYKPHPTAATSSPASLPRTGGARNSDGTPRRSQPHPHPHEKREQASAAGGISWGRRDGH